VIRVRPTRLLAIGALVLVAYLYWRPIHTYLRTKQALQTRHAQVHALSTEKTSLEQKIARANTGPDLIRQGKRPDGWSVDRDPYLLETSIPGVFAVGDVRHGSVKRVASGVGEGSIAIQFVHAHLAKV